jgi:hypothetical protein
MKKILTFLAIFLISILFVGEINAQKLDLRTREGKTALKRQKQLEKANAALQIGGYLSDKKNREKVKKDFKKVGKEYKEGFKNLKETYKNRKNKKK